MPPFINFKYNNMQKLPLFQFVILFLFLSVTNIHAQWEAGEVLDLNTTCYNAGRFSYETVYDNYGYHFVGRDYTGPNSRFYVANYFLIDNKGDIIDQEIDFGDNNLNTVTIGSYKGKVYVFTIKINGGSEKIKIYERINGESGLELKYAFYTAKY